MKNNLSDIVVLSALIGARTIENGGEIERAEDSAQRICTAYGLESVSVFALNSVIIVTGSDKVSNFTHTVRIKKSTPCMAVLENINDFSRRICKNTISTSDALCELEKICRQSSARIKLFGEIITALSFTLFYGGRFTDMLCALAIGIILHFEKIGLEHINLRPYIGYAVVTFALGIIIQLLNFLGLCENTLSIMLGCLMSMFPGITLVNASLSFLSSDTISAILQLIHSFLTALSIAAGFAFSVAVIGFLQ